MLNSTSLDSRLLLGLEQDCLSLYPDEYTQIKQLFSTVNFLMKSEGGCLELCQVGKALETALITGGPLRVPLSAFVKCKDGTSLPALGYFLWSRVFHIADQRPLVTFSAGKRLYCQRDRESAETEASYTNRICPNELQSIALAIFMLRQILLLNSKRTDIPTIAVEEAEESEFVKRVTAKPDITLSRAVLRTAKRYLRQIFMDESGSLHASFENWLCNPFGRHGPGAVFDGEIGKQKWDFCESITARITHPEFIDPTTEASAPKCRMTIVPKDFRKHRIICIEQKEMMFYQQGLRAVIEHIVHSNPLSRRCINYEDQSLNYRLSKDMKYSTIDLSDASDLLSRRLCKALLPKEVYKLLVNGRSASILLLSGDSIAYESMYTMGNALCFTIESIIFSSLVCAAISAYSGKSLEKSSWNYRVFGDDIIVKSEYYEVVLETLRSAGLLPNINKCCHHSLVRESCGSWFINGVDVRIARPVTMQIVSDTEWIAWLQMCINLTNLGLLTTATSVLSSMSSYYPVPYGFYGLPGDRNITRQSRDRTGQRVWRFSTAKTPKDPNFQREEFLMPVLQRHQNIRLEGRKGIYAYFTQQGTTFSLSQKTAKEWTALS